MNARKFFSALLAALFLLAAPALAKVVSNNGLFCLDNANVLSEDLEGEIYFSNVLLSEACGAEFEVVTLKTTGNEAIDDYAYELFNDWKIGDANKNNGFLLLLAIDDNDYYAMPGTGLQSKFTSGTIKQYFDRYLESDFASGNYEAGVRKFFEAAFERIADTYSANVTTAQGVQAYQNYLRQQSASNTGTSTHSSYGGNRPQSRRGGLSIGHIILIAILVIVVLRFLKRRRPAKPQSGFNVFGGGQSAYKPRPSGGSSFMKWYLLSQLFKSFTSSKPQNHHSSFFGSGFGGSSHSSHSGGSGFFGGFSSGGSSRPSGGFGGRRTGGGGSSRGGGAGRGRR